MKPLNTDRGSNNHSTFPSTLAPAKVYVLALLELIFVGLWCATFVSMLLKKGKGFKKLFDRPPYETWDVGAALAVCEM